MKSVDKQYIKEVGKLLPSSGARRKDYLKNLEISVQNYVLEHPCYTRRDLYEVFGFPEEIAKEFLEESDIKQISVGEARRKRLIIGALSLIIVCVVYLCVIKYIQYRKTLSIINGFTHEAIEELPSYAQPLPEPLEVH